MYSLSRRIQISAIIPTLIFFLYSLNYFIKSPRITNSNTLMLFAYLVLDVLIAYFVSLLFFSVETLIRVFITDREEVGSIELRNKLKNQNLARSLSSIFQADNTYQGLRITTSVVFQVAIAVVVFIAVTSSNSRLGDIIAISIFLQTLVEQGICLSNKKSIANWFWQTSINPAPQAQLVYFSVMAIALLLFLTMAT
ncbi:MAG: hypothetical protein M3P33_01910 [bacterium]|nr:hypothetical protein [bacterium]